ncbi:MAG: asparaginase, partial [Alphaproteobacteria bacterium]|nr:asparaginase [Alphaproteobacteria bacterium]
MNDTKTANTIVSLPQDTANPVLIEVTRGDMVESIHRGRVAVVDTKGKVALQFGDIDSPVYPRSAIKAMQALPLVESGAADVFGLSDAELAIACASHSGESRHVETVRAWLARMGLSEDHLECGPHWPRHHQQTLHDMVRAGETPGDVHNNCSGKHTGMLATAHHLGEPLAGYTKPTHPVQQRIMGILEALCGIDLSDAPRGTDGCSVPTWGIPLSNMALAFARLGAPDDLPPARADAAKRIRKAVAAAPFMVAGTDRYCTVMMEAAGEAVFVKTGAEGVFCAALPEYGLGIALKCDDGAVRGSQLMLTAILRRIGALDDALAAQLDSLI